MTIQVPIGSVPKPLLDRLLWMAERASSIELTWNSNEKAWTCQWTITAGDGSLHYDVQSQSLLWAVGGAVKAALDGIVAYGVEVSGDE